MSEAMILMNFEDIDCFSKCEYSIQIFKAVFLKTRVFASYPYKNSDNSLKNIFSWNFSYYFFMCRTVHSSSIENEPQHFVHWPIA